jgi:hypothetical protein
LVPARLHAIDGNNADKHLDGAGATDERTFESNYLIKPADVDIFADDGVAHSRKRAEPPAGPTPSGETAPSNKEPIPCTNNWIADNAKEQLVVFDITGPFISACRHGLVETLVEMRRSGEL